MIMKNTLYDIPKKAKMKNKSVQYKTYLNMRLEIVRENPVEYLQCRSADDVYNAFNDDISKHPNEIFRSVHLNCKNYIIGVETISMGSVTSSLVHPREVFKGAIINNATSLILLHNHPSGDPAPSQDDRDITQRLKQTGDILGVRILDHMIFGSKEIKPYFSFVEAGLL